jgi:hypothetical protein
VSPQAGFQKQECLGKASSALQRSASDSRLGSGESLSGILQYTRSPSMAEHDPIRAQVETVAGASCRRLELGLASRDDPARKPALSRNAVG